MSIDDLNRIIDVAYLWNTSEYRNSNDFISYKLIEWSRYAKYNDVVYQILLNTKDDRIEQVYEVLSNLSKMFFCYSIYYAKSKYEIHSFMYEIYKDISDFEANKDMILSKIRGKIQAWNNTSFKAYNLGGYISDNRIRKSLICILSDYIEEEEQGIDFNSYKEMYDDFDVEHIHANANEQEGNDIDDNKQNSIGNLMLLEPDINRSIGCLPFKEKVNRSDGGLCYKDSHYATVKKVMNNNEWELPEVNRRREEEISKISKFLFE